MGYSGLFWAILFQFACALEIKIVISHYQIQTIHALSRVDLTSDHQITTVYVESQLKIVLIFLKILDLWLYLFLSICPR